MTPDETMQLLERMTYWWGSFRLPDGDHLADMVHAWHQVLAPLPSAVVVDAVMSFVNEGGAFAPYPPQIQARANALIGRATGDRMPDADEAWNEAMKQVAHVGHWTPFENIEWSHPMIREAVGYYGWQELCAVENIGVARAQFFRIYDMVKGRAILDASISPSLLREVMGGDAGDFVNLDAPKDDE